MVARPFIKQITEGIQFLHSKNIIHGDLKCANILLDSNGCIKLADFGSSIELSNPDESHKSSTIKGTIPWIAPEVIKESKTYLSSDIWSLGCTIIEMCVGGNP